MTTARLPLHEVLTPDHVCAMGVRHHTICWHAYGRRADGSPFAVATNSDSSLGAQFRIRDEIPGAFFERIVIGASDVRPAPVADYR